MPARLLGAILVVFVAAGILPAATTAQHAVIEGRIVSSHDNHPVEFALLFLDEVRRSAMSDVQGKFVFNRIPNGHYTLQASRIGFHPYSDVIEVSGQDTMRLTIYMDPDILMVDEVVVESERVVGESEGVEHRMEGNELRQHLGTTIAETLSEEPGISMRSMGPAPARPVLRGLGGERLLVLENGGQTGDMSQTSSDHALVVDPLTADRLEIIRGPESLLFGPNTLAGAINVVRESILSSVPDRIQGTAAIQGQSVSQGLALGGAVSAPLGRAFALRVGGSYRTAGDVNTPEGRLGNTQLLTSTASAGLSRIGNHGFVGVSGSLYDSDYGIPGGFIGAHPNGVTVEVERRSLEVRHERLHVLPWIRRLETVGSWSRYFHQEFESSGALGIEYGLLNWNGRTLAYTEHIGPFEHGAVGIEVSHRDFASGGFSFTPDTRESSVAAFVWQDFHKGRNGFQVGARFDSRRVTPEREFVSDIGHVRERAFNGLSFSFSAERPLSDVLGASLMVMRGLRLPGIEELYSEGPHLAAYSFEVGSPDLDMEVGLGVEAKLTWQTRRLTGSAAVFHNRFDGYIFPRNTGELNYRIYVPIHQTTGTDAVMTGAEGQLSMTMTPWIGLSATGSWVRGDLTDMDTPIPWMPPLRGSMEATWKRNALNVSLTLRAASGQHRLGPFEEATDGYIVPDLAFQYHGVVAGMLHTVTLAVDNLTDTAYRDHLSRVKSIMPEPGRNVRLIYKVFL
jgi:iron complex outermembrane receptor protein